MIYKGHKEGHPLCYSKNQGFLQKIKMDKILIEQNYWRTHDFRKNYTQQFAGFEKNYKS